MRAKIFSLMMAFAIIFSLVGPASGPSVAHAAGKVADNSSSTFNDPNPETVALLRDLQAMLTALMAKYGVSSSGSSSSGRQSDPSGQAAKQPPVDPAQTASECLDTQEYLTILSSANTKHPGNDQRSLHKRISETIRQLNIRFRENPNIGTEFEPGVNVSPSSSGVSIAYTDTGDSEELIPQVNTSAPGGITANWIPVARYAARADAGKSKTNGWGLWRLHTSAVMQTSGRLINLCSALPTASIRAINQFIASLADRPRTYQFA